ncbi:hypothetical protein CLOM_g3361 [Closterium sp. NIES-68]|nr:hypothetical protein CLOM_g21807 [Closterium sp. NIES-68]GJP43963.1 hypothetical protein CLOM_g3361 [Closterium sp. NIES-68]GJP84303.1 hypothetical protein CLOP_g14364 [Closterium sp. NIES-67]
MMACHAPNLMTLCPRLRAWAEERHLAVAIPSPPDCISDFPEERQTSPSLQEQRRLLLGSRCGTPRSLFRRTSAISATSAAPATSSSRAFPDIRSATAQPASSEPSCAPASGRSYTTPAEFCDARSAENLLPGSNSDSRETAARSPHSGPDASKPAPGHRRSSSDCGTSRLMKLARCDLLGSRCGTPRRATGADPWAFHHRPRSVTWHLPRDEIPFSYSMPVPSRGGLRLLRADVLGSKCGTPKFRAPAEPEAIWSL